MGRGSKWRMIVLCLAAVPSSGIPGALNASAQVSPRVQSGKSRWPLRFEASKSPSDDPVKYTARASSYSLFLSNDEADVVLHGEQAPPSEVTRGKLIVVRAYASLLRMRFVDSNPPTSIVPIDRVKQPGSYYAAVAYRGLYAGTDVIVRGDQQRIAFQLNLSPGSDSGHIVLEIAGATFIELDSAGDAIVHTGNESLILKRPVVKTGTNSPFAGAYRIEHGNRLRFVVNSAAFENNQVSVD